MVVLCLAARKLHHCPALLVVSTRKVVAMGTGTQEASLQVLAEIAEIVKIPDEGVGILVFRPRFALDGAESTLKQWISSHGYTNSEIFKRQSSLLDRQFHALGGWFASAKARVPVGVEIASVTPTIKQWFDQLVVERTTGLFSDEDMDGVTDAVVYAILAPNQLDSTVRGLETALIDSLNGAGPNFRKREPQRKSHSTRRGLTARIATLVRDGG